MMRRSNTRRGGIRLAAVMICATAGAAADAQQERLSRPYFTEIRDRIPSYNLYGLPGLVDMPTAEMAPDATLGVTVSNFGNTTRGTLSFQVLPRVIGTFRYARLQDSNIPGNRDGDYFDRSFDLRVMLLDETTFLPALSVGLRDFVGTGLYAGEYVVATKEIVPGVRVTGGLGWGRLGTNNPIATVGTRPNTVNGALDPSVIGTGGEANFDTYFRGDAAPFGGVSWDIDDNWRLKVEYSSDDYTIEETRTTSFERNSSFNFGVDYTFDNGTQLSLYSLYGSEFGAQLSFPLNLKTAQISGGNDPAPLPVAPRPAAQINMLGWAESPELRASISEQLAEALIDQGIRLEGLSMTARTATARIDNLRYPVRSQAIGRTARTMTRILPSSISDFTIVLTQDGLPLSAVDIARGDLERFEFEAAQEMYPRVRFTDAVGRTPPVFDDVYPRFGWSLRPYLRYSAFDPDDPLRTEYGVRANGDVVLAPGLEMQGTLAYPLGGNIAGAADDTSTRLPSVRTSFPLFADTDGLRIDDLTLAYYARPAEDFYGRMTVGYLERMYAGVSAELLWKPVDSRLALGAEVNYVRLRDYDGGFGIQENATPEQLRASDAVGDGTFPELNGHVSAYYDLGYGFHTQLDVGRYLAGDYGATLTVAREFENGWRVGAFATQTDVSADEFGEGSFDKGITITIPFAVLGGRATQRTRTDTIRPITRDGGARVSVPGRLYGRVREAHDPEIAKSWGRFWR
ncbi:hypothetical protein ROJ8625_00774 [Roseivivax jejudonensis]|uniref:Exopolysaccharide biosynthesis protein YbjH n=1 Tax=Roseivivax jejudonensis TaxID=1529041 RepID=A0A1X6YHF9_9RHOB|nr:YjbH domain-containing protein [Roseivivax jejudonensis]SLN21135.1 hypothetical protein ROJ8625_00774 [Roseivivax jejudonensis]